MTEKQLNNIKPHRWKKGQSGNPGGKPKQLVPLKELMANCLGKTKEEAQCEADKILEAVRKKARAGDLKAAEFLFSYGYAKPRSDEPDDHNIVVKIIREGD
jgi:hypothetical protein